jgi:hypothetical protein
MLARVLHAPPMAAACQPCRSPAILAASQGRRRENIQVLQTAHNTRLTQTPVKPATHATLARIPSPI